MHQQRLKPSRAAIIQKKHPDTPVAIDLSYFLAVMLARWTRCYGEGVNAGPSSTAMLTLHILPLKALKDTLCHACKDGFTRQQKVPATYSLT